MDKKYAKHSSLFIFPILANKQNPKQIEQWLVLDSWVNIEQERATINWKKLLNFAFEQK